MKNKSKVDVALITKNHEKYIEDAINSLLDQTIPINSINIVDDASTDFTNYKIRKLVKKNSLINLITNSHSLGPGAASNLAFRELRGDFILYTSGDDISTTNRAEIQTHILMENPKFNCVVSQVELIIESKDLIQSQIPKFIPSSNTGLRLFSELFWKQNFLNASASFFRRSGNSIITFEERLLHLQDFNLWLELSLKNQIMISPEQVLKYRVHKTSLSQKVNQIESHVNSSNEELFSIYVSLLSELKLDEIIKIFQPFIDLFKKSQIESSSKSSLIDFLLLSHNNPYLNKRVIDKLKSDYTEGSSKVESLLKFIHEYFYSNINLNFYLIKNQRSMNLIC